MHKFYSDGVFTLAYHDGKFFCLHGQTLQACLPAKKIGEFLQENVSLPAIDALMGGHSDAMVALGIDQDWVDAQYKKGEYNE